MLTWQWISDYCHCEGYVLARMLGAYAVAADPMRPLKQLVLHNRLFDIQVGLAAVTLNRDETRVVPALVEDLVPPQTPLLSDPTARAPYLSYKNGRLIGGNTFYQSTIDWPTTAIPGPIPATPRNQSSSQRHQNPE